MIKLSKRQKAIVELIPECGVLGDIGCDHGLIGAFALEQNICVKTYFCDISQHCLDKAKKLVGQTQLQNAEFFCQDGLKDLRCDCAVIAGMGGLETISILQKAEFLPKFLVLQPMRNQFDLRLFLCNNYYIKTDKLFFDRKFYNLILAEKGSDNLDNLQLLFGKTNLEHPTKDFVDYLKKEISKCNAILRQTDSEIVKLRLKSLRSAALRLKEEI